METNQQQTSTTGRTTQNCVQSNHIAENSAVINQPAGEPTDQNVLAQNSENHFPQSSGKPAGQKPATWVASPIERKKYFSFKNCKAWNQYKQTGVTQYIKGNIDPDYTGCTILNIPDDPHPWNAMRTIIDQFYQRERDIAWERYEARKAIEKATKIEDRNNQLCNARWILDSRIGDLKKELSQAHDKIAELESNQPAKAASILLDELLQQSNAGEWVDNMGDIIDCIIGLMAYDGNTVSSSDLYFARRLQQFFMKLDKATKTIAEQS